MQKEREREWRCERNGARKAIYLVLQSMASAHQSLHLLCIASLQSHAVLTRTPLTADLCTPCHCDWPRCLSRIPRRLTAPGACRDAITIAIIILHITLTPQHRHLRALTYTHTHFHTHCHPTSQSRLLSWRSHPSRLRPQSLGAAARLALSLFARLLHRPPAPASRC